MKNAYISNWFVLTQIFMLYLCYRQKEAEFIRSIVDKIYSDSSLIVYEDGLIGMGSLVEETNQRMFAFFGICGWSGAQDDSPFFFFQNFFLGLTSFGTKGESLCFSGPRFAQAIAASSKMSLTEHVVYRVYHNNSFLR